MSKAKYLIYFWILFFGVSGGFCSSAETLWLFGDFHGDAANLKLPPTVVRSRMVSVNFDRVWMDASAEPSKIAGTLNLNLFPDVTFTAVLDRLEKNTSGSFTWIGHLEGNPFETVTLVVNDNIILGNIHRRDRLYAVRYSGEYEAHIIQEIDPSKFPRD